MGTMGTVVLVAVVLVTVGLGAVHVYRIHKQRARCEWLEGLLDPSVSLKTLMFSLHQAFPYSCNTREFVWSYLFDGSANIKLKKLRALFSERLMWRLVDVFVKNAEQHFKTLSICQPNGLGLVAHLYQEIFELFGFEARAKIENSPLSEEAKQKLLS